MNIPKMYIIKAPRERAVLLFPFSILCASVCKVKKMLFYTTKKDIDECTEKEALEVFSYLQKPREFNEDVIGKLKK